MDAEHSHTPGREMITENELLDALREASPSNKPPVGALTMQQLTAATGWNTKRVAQEIRRLQGAGRCTVVRVPLMRIDGRPTQTAAYAFSRPTTVKKMTGRRR